MNTLFTAAIALLCGAGVGYVFCRTQAQAAQAVLQERAESLTARLQQVEAEVEEGRRALLAANHVASEKEAALRADLVRAQERQQQAESKLAASQTEALAQQAQMKEWLENTANRVLKSTSEQLNQNTQQQMEVLLAPVKERLAEFKSKVEEVHGKGAEQHGVLKTLIEQLHQTHTTLHDDTTNLTKALKGDSQKRGQWGEIRLETILQNSGLKEGENYIRQGLNMALKGEEGEAQRPDVLVYIPQGNERRYVVIDSKVSLNGYLEWTRAEDGTPEQSRAQKSFLDSVRAHVNDLAGKKYQDNAKLIAHDQVLLFIPNEAMFTAAVDLDPSLFDYAWARRVALVSPTTLMLTLSVVASVWRLDNQQRNANEIAEVAAALYDKMAGVFEAFDALGAHLRKSGKAYDMALSRLRDGNGSVIKKLDSLKSLGVSVKKDLPALTALNSEPAEEEAEEA